jgi:hypothetical protein
MQQSTGSDSLNRLSETHLVSQQRPFVKGQMKHSFALVREQRRARFVLGINSLSRLQVPDLRPLFSGPLLSQSDFVLIRRSPIVSARQLGVLALRIIAPRVPHFPRLSWRVHPVSGE